MLDIDIDVSHDSGKVDYIRAKASEVIQEMVTAGTITIDQGFSLSALDRLTNYLFDNFDDLAYNDLEFKRVITVFIIAYENGIKDVQKMLQQQVREGKLFMSFQE